MIIEALFFYIFDTKFLYQLIAVLCTLIVLRIAIFYRNRHQRHQLFKNYGIPGPEPNLLGGNLHLYHSNQARYRIDEQLTEKYGPVYGIFIGDEPSLVISDVNILKKIFFDESKSFTERSLVFLDTPMSHGILFAPYNRWKAMRKVMSPSFSSYNMRGDASSKFIEDSISLMINHIDCRLDEAQAAKTKPNIDIHSLMKSTALYLISQMAIKLPDVKVQEDEENVKHLDKFLGSSDKGPIVVAIMFGFLKPVMQFIVKNFEYAKILSTIHRGLNRVINDTLAKLSTNNYEPTEYPQVIDTLIKLHHEGKITREEIMGNVETILFAGYDTTSTTLTYFFWVVAKYPDIQERLRAELVSHGIESKYLLQVLNETMRIYPTVINFTTRLATQTVEINGLVIPKGVRVVHNNWLMHRNPKLWSEPEKFDPDRFSPDKANIHPCAYAPFGLGERRCLGYQLAMLEMKMICCDILVRYRLRLKSPENLELISYAGVLTKPKEKVMIELERLTNAH